ncbi:MAG TPA: acyl-CoA dehydrogenase family protein [Polyangiales bacterium]|nr:acyl-CoA dehydrogenase family protein [Polyangiales bacterium]
MFNLEPTEEQQLMVQTARELAKNEMDPKAHDADEAAALPTGFLAKSWELGIACPAIPEQYEGAAMERSAVTGALILEELGAGDLSMALALLAPASVAYPVLDYGTESQKDRYLRACTAAEFPKLTAALMEPDYDFDPTALRTTASKDAKGYVLNGVKCRVPNASTAETFLVYAREGTAEGFGAVSAFFVPRNTPGLSIGDKEKNLGVHALDSATITLKDVHLPPDARLGGDRGCDFERIMSYSRIALSALAVGVARRAYEHSVAYALERKTWGQPIATRQSVAFSVADMRMELDAARLLVWEAAWQLDRGNMATRESYLAKLTADEMVLKVTDEAVMVMGGHGFIRENPVERWLRNGRGFAVFEGLAMV